MMRRLAMAVGDTAGHVMPALAVADAYRRQFPDTEIRFFAAGEGAGHWLVERDGFPLDLVPGSQMVRTTRLNQVLAIGRTALGVRRARALLRRHGTRLVLGTGGYGSAAALLAARSLGLRTALIEPNIVPGLANRLLGGVVDRAYVAFDETAARFPQGRALVTGIPLRPGISSDGEAHPAPQFPRLRLLVMSGSRGEHFLGERVPQVCESLAQDGIVPEVRHQGGGAAASIQHAYDQRGIAADAVPFIADVAGALRWADLAIARAGAGTIAELAAAGIPALLVPLGDAAHDHQAFNARALAARGAAWMIREDEWTTRAVADRIAGLVHDPPAWDRMSRAMRSLAREGGAARVVEDCEVLMEGRW